MTFVMKMAENVRKDSYDEAQLDSSSSSWKFVSVSHHGMRHKANRIPLKWLRYHPDGEEKKTLPRILFERISPRQAKMHEGYKAALSEQTPVRIQSKKNPFLEDATRSPWTINLRHMLSTTKKEYSKDEPLRERPLEAQHRIKWWNVVPGDRIRVLKDAAESIHDVVAVNKYHNMVFVKRGDVNSNFFHYSRCQLYVGNYDLPSKEDPSKSESVPVFAQRIGTTSPKWNPYLHRFSWQRFAVKTSPAIPQLTGQRLEIPWPEKSLERKKPDAPEATSFDTTKEEVSRVTYKPPLFSPSLKGLAPRPPSERDFLTQVVNTHIDDLIADDAPVEVHLVRELSNPHSRAKKIARHNERVKEEKAQFKIHVATEIAELKKQGIPEREARAEAVWKWSKMKRLTRVLHRRRTVWRTREAVLKRRKKEARKERKVRKEDKRLRTLELLQGRNQVIPSTATV